MGRFSFQFPLGRVEISYSFGEVGASVRGNGLFGCGVIQIEIVVVLKLNKADSRSNPK
jgi:hypothetical protein